MMSTPSAAPAGETLSRLVQACRDAQAGYQFAAQAVTEAILRAEMLQYSRQRAEFVVDLMQALRSLGDWPHDPSTMQTPASPQWASLKQPADRSNRGVVKACHLAEVDAVDLYRQSLGSGLPMQIASLVHSQFAAISRVKDRLHSLADTISEQK